MQIKKLAVLAAFVFTVAFAGAEVTNLSCDQTGATEYKLAFSLTRNSHEVKIFAGTNAAHPTGDAILTTHDTTVTVQAGQPGQRIYFFIKPDHGEQREVSIRHLALQGTPNFRDLGGYQTTDGHYTHWGIIYRSGVLGNLTPTDLKTSPEVWIPNTSVEHISLPIGGTSAKDSSGKSVSVIDASATPQQLKERMQNVYGNFAFTNAPEYSKVFVQLEQDKLPLLYHCTAGKDRTGVFSALLLLTLGVPQDTVLADFQLTDKYLLHGLSQEAKQKMLATNPEMGDLSPEQRDVVMSADPDFLRSTLHQIDVKYGSFDNYRRQALGVSDEQVKELRSRLLEK
jgi:protein-tyrosine phosphatase